MKYLTKYSIFENKDLWDNDISDNIKDILVDLQDDGYKIEVKYYPGYGNTTPHGDFRYSYYIVINFPKIVNDKELEDKIDQLSSFMDTEGYPNGYSRDFTKPNQTPFSKYMIIYFAKNSYEKPHDKYWNGISVDEAKKISPEDNFKGIVDDVFTESKDEGFFYTIDCEKSTYYINVKRCDKSDPLRLSGRRFKWGEIKDTITMLVNYLSDIYPKINFNEFRAVTTKKQIQSVSRYPSLRSILREDKRSIVSYILKDFMSKIEDSDTLENISIQCLVRFRGKF